MGLRRIYITQPALMIRAYKTSVERRHCIDHIDWIFSHFYRRGSSHHSTRGAVHIQACIDVKQGRMLEDRRGLVSRCVVKCKKFEEGQLSELAKKLKNNLIYYVIDAKRIISRSKKT